MILSENPNLGFQKLPYKSLKFKQNETFRFLKYYFYIIKHSDNAVTYL
nr:MAG TPA: hypothetical protein [Caudoviricetes sp.]